MDPPPRSPTALRRDQPLRLDPLNARLSVAPQTPPHPAVFEKRTFSPPDPFASCTFDYGSATPACLCRGRRGSVSGLFVRRGGSRVSDQGDSRDFDSDRLRQYLDG